MSLKKGIVWTAACMVPKPAFSIIGANTDEQVTHAMGTTTPSYHHTGFWTFLNVDFRLLSMSPLYISVLYVRWVQAQRSSVSGCCFDTLYQQHGLHFHVEAPTWICEAVTKCFHWHCFSECFWAQVLISFIESCWFLNANTFQILNIFRFVDNRW